MEADTVFLRGMLMDEEGGGGQVEFQWNPASLKISKHIKWNQMHTAGREAPILQYGCGEARKVSFELDLSRSDRGESYVRTTIKKIMEMTKPTVKGSGVDRPPKVTLMMGSFVFSGYIDNVEGVHELLASPWSLDPYDGKCKIEILEVIDAA